MKNIKNFDDFINEGALETRANKFIINTVRNINRKLNPGELDDVIKKILDDIKINFDITKLIYRETNKSMRDIAGYEYITSKGDKINVNDNGLWINGELIEHINKSYQYEIWDFFTDKYKNKVEEEKEREKRIKISDFKNKYNKYLY